MTHELGLWDAVGTPPSTANEFSREAAESIIGHVGSIRRQVARIIANEPLIEAWRIEQRAPYHAGNTIRPRLVELQRAGIIYIDPEPGKTPSGRKCSRYRITPLGRKLLAL